MLAHIKGILELKTREYVIIDVNGMGYKIFMPETSMQKMGEIGQTVKVHTYLRVSQDDIKLYGFNSNDEFRMFELLLSVGGIGAKSAIGILSNITPSGFALAVINDDVSKIKSLPGIGAKSAQRIILELKDKLKKEQSISEEEMSEIKSSITQSVNCTEAISALQVLGYNKKEIEKALENIDKDNLSVEDIIRKGLSNLSK